MRAPKLEKVLTKLVALQVGPQPPNRTHRMITACQRARTDHMTNRDFARRPQGDNDQIAFLHQVAELV
jgi:hypothetical protein